jgi:hypothetical protein
MSFDAVIPYLFFAVFAAVAGSFIVKIVRHGGFRAALFGAPLERTVGEVRGGGTRFMNIAVRVHVLGGGEAEKAVGLELVAKSFASYQMTPVTLSAAEARKLALLLQSATAGRG